MLASPRCCVLALGLLACGGTRPTASPTPVPIVSAQPAAAELPAPLVSYMRSHGWGPMHLRWHSERRWDQLPPAAAEYAKRQGWARAARQEGESGNGVEFLAMHRAMIELLREADPSARSSLEGWASPPTDPTTTEFDAEMLKALDRLAHHLDSFASEDELGLYIETSFRPAPGQPTMRAEDRSAGVHNYLHQRFQDPSSPIDLGNPSTNLLNPRFWRLHGWIDRVWGEYRAQKGLRDSDAGYQTLMREAKAHMSMRMRGPLEAPPVELIEAVRP